MEHVVYLTESEQLWLYTLGGSCGISIAYHGHILSYRTAPKTIAFLTSESFFARTWQKDRVALVAL